jgi:hypothetical protein
MEAFLDRIPDYVIRRFDTSSARLNEPVGLDFLGTALYAISGSNCKATSQLSDD